MRAQTAAAFRFDAEEHIYTDEHGRTLPSITQMLAKTGWVDERWYTEEGSDRGSAVHRLSAEYDMGALDLQTTVTKYRGYLLGHVKAMEQLRPMWTDVEVPHVHPGYRFGGRPDRIGVVLRLKTVGELKTGKPEQSHGIQTALQAILAAECSDLKVPHAWQRIVWYVNDKGRFKVERFNDRRDFDEALRIVRVCC